MKGSIAQTIIRSLDALHDTLTPDYDPWTGYEWPDKAGQMERAPRKKPVDR